MSKLHVCIPPHLLCRALLYGGMKESQPGTTQIELKDTSASAFGILLKYMYSGRLNLLEIKVTRSLRLVANTLYDPERCIF